MSDPKLFLEEIHRIDLIGCGDPDCKVCEYNRERALHIIAAHDAAIRAECAERAVKWITEQTGGIDPAIVATNSGKWLLKLREKKTASLRAAIMGEP